MEIREITGLFVSVYTDDLMPFSYIKILTDTTLESVKLPSRFRDSKFAHYCSPYNLIKLEIIRTRKNWIVRDIAIVETIVSEVSFSHMLKHTHMLKVLAENITEGQQLHILPWFIDQLKQATHEINIDSFQKLLDYQLNFSTV